MKVAKSLRMAPTKKLGVHVQLDALAERISAHLKRFEQDPKINRERKEQGLLLPYYWPNCYRCGQRIAVSYVSYQGTTKLTREEAEKYLAWLDKGKVGRHYDCLGHRVGVRKV